MFFSRTKTVAVLGLAAISGAAAGEYPSEGYPAEGYPAEPVQPQGSSSVAVLESSAPAPYASSSAVPSVAAEPSAPPRVYYSYFNTTVTTTVVVEALTTVCPLATVLTYGDVPYTATEGETVTVEGCPCTVEKVIPTLASTPYPPGVTPADVAPGPVSERPHPSPFATPYPAPAAHPSPAPRPAPAPAPAPAAVSPAAPYPVAPHPQGGHAAPTAGVPRYSATPAPQPSHIQVAGAPVRSPTGLFAAFALFLGALAL
ncbi:hypothetical protein GGS23DRAFT_608923 [Durotheca rogersii]|uniref:uncharacterized protein n=1 Tax=Durotheca rogersii TaxID=419775 RepID=UPI00221ECC79|nr:uncharacterized protein GGS23DRAFT_608923 [Durotheca rogersii]KAI5868282.1 hypothetical protein GGS23DRAFT_608923 [Durotheca rogersii]